MDAVHSMTSVLEWILQNTSPKYQQLSNERIILGGMITPPRRRSATARDIMRVPGLLTELPSVDGAVVINPWDYLQRMSMYKVLLNTTGMYMTSMGPDASENPLWGLPLQLGWKLKSGRLIDPTGKTSCGQETGDPMCVSPQSWYACVNYYLSVIPFLAAVETGIVGQGSTIQIQAPTSRTDDQMGDLLSGPEKHQQHI
ncbi:hypothetical protein AAFF_G00178810 [Aldrovandia affinis]|uniref:Uncharacterized protein n=1 Tax=Aldrovandia affinis TaxID=143900 RepID=A0AAD7W7Q1_9TELE|nr:hypothetical protein AAFF_G00178810 [Aldrovandia affinis]